MVITTELVLAIFVTLLGANSIGRALVDALLVSRRQRQLARQADADAARRQREAEEAGRRAAQQVLEDQGLKRIGDLEQGQRELKERADRAEERAERAEERADEAERREQAAEGRAQTAEARTAEVLGRLEAETVARQAAEGELKTERAEKVELVKQLTELRSAYDRVETEHSALQSKTNGMQVEIDQLRQQLLGLTSKENAP